MQREWTGRLCLGTVQFGMRYGVKNARGRQPTAAECCAVLDAARAGGITYLDTASTYGTAEEVLGFYGLAGKGFHVCSKLRPHAIDEPYGNQEETQAFVVREARASLTRLGIPHLYGYLLHRAEDLQHPGVVEGLIEVQREGLAEHVGVSVYEPEEAFDVLRTKRLDLIQIPYNALDQRLDRAGFFEAVREQQEVGRPFVVFARSAFLQGLLLMDPHRLPLKVARAAPFVARFQKIAERHGFAPHEAAMLYSLTHAGIDHVVFGVDTESQLAENFAVAAKAEMFAPCAEALAGAFDDVPRELVMPCLW